MVFSVLISFNQANAIISIWWYFISVALFIYVLFFDFCFYNKWRKWKPCKMLLSFFFVLSTLRNIIAYRIDTRCLKLKRLCHCSLKWNNKQIKEKNWREKWQTQLNNIHISIFLFSLIHMMFTIAAAVAFVANNNWWEFLIQFYFSFFFFFLHFLLSSSSTSLTTSSFQMNSFIVFNFFNIIS